MALTKVFRIELTGGGDVQKDITAIKTAMSGMANAISKAKGEMATLLSTNADPTAISNLTAKIADLEAKMKSLSQIRKTAETDAKRQAEAEKLLADAKLKEAQAAKAQAQADAERIKSQIAQEKELDRQIALEQKEQQALEKKKRVLDALPGSYNEVRNALNQLRPQIQSGNEGSLVNFGGQQISFSTAIEEFKRLSAAEQEFRRQFTRDGTLVGEYSSGIVDAFKRLNIDDIIKNQVNGAKQQLSSLQTKTNELVITYRAAQQQNITSTTALEQEIGKLSLAYDEAKAKGSADLEILRIKLEELQQAYHNTQQQGSADLNRLEQEIHGNVVETQHLQQAVQQAEVQLKGVGGVGEKISASINQGFKNLKNSIAQFALTYVGFFAAFNEFRKAVELNAELSDSFAQLQIYLHGSKADVDNLVESLKKIPTRTSLERLVDISTIVAKKGVAKEEITGVTQALDQLFIVLGKEAGDPHEAVSSLVKLVNVYSEDKHVTAKNIGDIGAAIQKLTSSGVATGDFLINFAERLAGVRGITGVSIQNVLGLGAAIQELGQRSETAGTAASQLIIKLFTDIPKYAGFAGKSVAEFTKTVTQNPVEALIQLAQGLKNNKEGLDEVAQAFDQAGIHGARVVGVLGDIAGNADYMRKRIRDANAAFGDQASLVEAVAIKQNTFAATLDNVKKKFELLGTSKGFQVTLSALASLVLLLINNLPILLTLGGLLAVSWAAQNTQLIVLNAQIIGYNLAIGASYIALGILTIAQTAYNAVLFITNGAVVLVTRALSFFGITVKATSGPLGIILAVVSLLAAAFAAFGRRLEDARGSLTEYMRFQRINVEISREAAKATGDQIAKLDGWIAVVKSAATSADTKRRAMEKLIEINPAFRDAIKGQTIDLNELDKAYVKVVQGIQAKARAEASATLSASKQKKITEIAGLRQDIEIQLAQTKNKIVTDVELTDSQIEILKKSNLQSQNAIVQFKDNGAQIDIQRSNLIIRFLEKKEAEAISTYQDYLKAQAQAEEALTKVEEDFNKTNSEKETVFQIFQRLVDNNGTQADFKELLKKIEAQKKQTAVTSKEYKDLLALEKKVKDLISPKTGSSAGSKLSGEQKDAFKDIDAIRDRLLAEQKQLFLNLQMDERSYLENILQINTEAIDKKLKLLKGKNAEERKIIAQLNLEKINDQKETNQKLFELDNKQLEINQRNTTLSAQQRLDLTNLNPDISNEQRLQAKEDYFNNLLKAQIVFNQAQIALEKKYGVLSIENEQKRKESIEKIQKDLDDTEKGRVEARQKDMQAAADRQLAEIRRRVSDQTIAILESNSSYTQKAKDLAKLERQATKDQLAVEAAAAKVALDQAKKDRNARLISEKEYLDKLEEYKTKEASLYKVTTDEQVSATNRFIKALQELKDQFVSNLLGIKQYTDDAEGEQERVKDAVQQTQDTIKKLVNDAYQAYFKNQEARIDRDKQEQTDYLDREKQRVEARATSEAEKDTIDRQYAQKQKDVEKKAADEKRKLALKQATIDFAVAVIKTFAQFGFPLGLLPVAALTAAYIFQRSQIQQQQFARGGILKKKQYGFGGNENEVPINGGKFGGRPHSQGGTDFSFNGNSYNAEVDEIGIIRTKDAPKNKVYTITGNHTQIASALNNIGGGVSFAPGAAVKKLATGSYLGSQLKAPHFSAANYQNGGFVGGSNNNADRLDRLDRLEGITEQVLAAVYSTDKKAVVLDSRKVTTAQKKTKKDITVGII